jgi:hypothetical protein
MTGPVDRLAALEALAIEVVRVNTFTAYGRTPELNTSLRTPLGNQAAAALGLPILPTNGGLNASWDMKA